jgi:hypothetical protein
MERQGVRSLVRPTRCGVDGVSARPEGLFKGERGPDILSAATGSGTPSSTSTAATRSATSSPSPGASAARHTAANHKCPGSRNGAGGMPGSAH